MSPVDLKKIGNVACPYCFIYVHVTCRISEMIMSHVTIFSVPRRRLKSLPAVDFKKGQCHYVEFRGQGPSPHLYSCQS